MLGSPWPAGTGWALPTPARYGGRGHERAGSIPEPEAPPEAMVFPHRSGGSARSRRPVSTNQVTSAVTSAGADAVPGICCSTTRHSPAAITARMSRRRGRPRRTRAGNSRTAASGCRGKASAGTAGSGPVTGSPSSSACWMQLEAGVQDAEQAGSPVAGQLAGRDARPAGRRSRAPAGGDLGAAFLLGQHLGELVPEQPAHGRVLRQRGQGMFELAPVVTQLEGCQGGYRVPGLRDGCGFGGHRRGDPYGKGVIWLPNVPARDYGGKRPGRDQKHPRAHRQDRRLAGKPRNDGSASMPATRDLDPGASPARFFGAEVRRARMPAALTLADLAATVPCDASTVSRIEAGTLSPGQRFAAACDEAFPQMDGWFTRFYHDSRTWAGPHPPWFRNWVETERRATVIRWWEPLLIPGLLQTPDYARAVLGWGPDDGGDLDERVAARLDRRRIFDRDSPPEAWILLGEPVLSYGVGSADVMRKQIDHLGGMAARPRVTIQRGTRQGRL